MLLRLLFVALIITVSGCVSSLFSETVKLINGKAIVGDLIKVADETVSVESKGEEVIIRKDRIQSIVFQSDMEDENIKEVILVSTTCNARKRKHYAIGFEVAQDADPKLDPYGGAIYIQHIWDSGIGFQANVVGYGADIISGYGIDVNISYTFPIILSYHIFRSSVLSPYIGIGVSRSVYTSEKWWAEGWHVESERKLKKGFSPLVDVGVAFGANSPMQVVLNMKYFVSLYTSKANMLTAGVGVSINW